MWPGVMWILHLTDIPFTFGISVRFVYIIFVSKDAAVARRVSNQVEHQGEVHKDIVVYFQQMLRIVAVYMCPA